MSNKRLFKYTNSQNLKTTLDITEITPIYWNVLYPGEKIKNLSYQNLTRMIPPLYPTLDNPKISLYAFAVPKRILIRQNIDNPNLNILLNSEFTDNAFKAFWGQKKDDYININKDLISEYSYINDTRLTDKFGIKQYGHNFASSGVYGETGNFNLIYNLAYWKIYEQFFKEKQLEDFDYWKLYNYLTDYNNDRFIKQSLDTTKNNKKYAALRLLNSIAVVNTDNDYLNSFRYNFENIKLQELGVSGSTFFNFNSFKNAVFQQYAGNKVVQSKMQKGTVKDILVSVWNSNNGDKTNPILLGFDDYNQTIQQVQNTAKTSTEYLGEVGGMSMTYNKGALINDFVANEETIIMVLAVPNYKVHYSGTYDFSEFNFLKVNVPGVPSGVTGGETNEFNNDAFNPGMEVAFQPVLNGMFSMDANKTTLPTSLSTLAYEPAFNYLRNKKDVLAGEVMDLTKWGTWTYTSEINVVPSELGLNYLKARKKPFKDTLINPNGDSFITEFNFSTTILRTIKPEKFILENLAEGK